MAEKYPREWKLSCLELLRAHKESIRRSLGFRRLGWEVIRDKIMEPYDKLRAELLMTEDPRLMRQNLEGWDRGADISDAKFAFIDSYIRQLALNGEDADAKLIVAESRFSKITAAFADVYMRHVSKDDVSQLLLDSLPWTIYSPDIKGSWYRRMFMRADRMYNGILTVVVGYLPVPLDEYRAEHSAAVVIFEGYVLPLEDNSSSTEYRDEPIQGLELKCSVKLARPEYRGLSGSGYADGDMVLVISDRRSIGPYATLKLPSPVSAPKIDVSWVDQAEVRTAKLSMGLIYEEPWASEPKAERGQELDFSEDFRSNIDLLSVPRWDRIVTDIIKDCYTGYADQ